jgi:glycine/D-amino acid oxidase-like deaminating enzyme
MSSPSTHVPWGVPPWEIGFVPAIRPIPEEVDFAVVGAGFTGLAAAAWLRLLHPQKFVVVVESGRIGAGASGRTGGMALAESAAGDLPGLGDVLNGFSGILTKLRIDCELSLPGAWEIGRIAGLQDSAIRWNDSGILRVVSEVPGGTLDPGKLVTALAKVAEELGAVILENQRVERIRWGQSPELEFESRRNGMRKVHARKVLLATNALSLPLSGLADRTHPKLTLAALTAPLPEEDLQAIGLGQRKPFYTVDFPYLWGRVRHDNSIVWGAGLVDAEKAGGLESIDIASAGPSRVFASLEKRIQGLHPALASVQFTHRWGGPILFRDDWRPVVDFHPESRNGIVLGAYAGHGVALSSYLGAWAAEALLGRRELPDWGKISA